MYYGEKTIKEVDEYYGINIDNYSVFPYWKQSDCEKIQKVFNTHGIQLTLVECKEVYGTYSDETSRESCYKYRWYPYIDKCSEEELFELLQPWLTKIIQDRINRICTLTEQLEQGGYIKKDSDK